MNRLALIALALLAGCGQQMSSGSGPVAWQTLFDGQTLNGWDTRGAAQWVVENGYVTAVPTSGDGFLVTEGVYDDYRMQVEFWADATANGGIYMRVPDGVEGANPAYEVNIMDAHPQWPTGSISSVSRVDNPQTTGRWATFDITMIGDSVNVIMDGRQVAAGSMDRAASGKIALQKLGQGVIRYRNIRVAPL